MLILKIRSKRIQSIVITLVIAGVAVAGLLLIMSQLASSEETVTHQPDPVQQPVTATETASPDEEAEEDVVATVNDQIITREAWQKATRLDAVMNQLARQPIATAEETLDRLVNEIVVLEAVSSAGGGDGEPPTAAELEARTLALEQSWQVNDEAVVAALAEVGLTRDDLLERVGRLIQVEAALKQLAAQEADLNAWLAQARASAEIGLYHALVDLPPTPVEESTQETNLAEASTQGEPIVDKTEIFAPPPEMPIAPYVENAAPDFTLAQLDGESLKLSDFRGKPTIVNFWASWCPPCRHELPALQAAYDAHRDEIGFIAVDVKEEPGTVNSFIKELGLSFPVAFDLDGQVSDISYEVRGLPTTIFVDVNGVVAARHVGPLDEATIDSYLTPLLEQATQLARASITSPEQTTPAEGDESTPAATLISDDSLISVSTDNDHSAGDEGQQTETSSTADSTLAPDFTLASATGEAVSLQDYRDQRNVVLVFYRGKT
jgi:cytochrome c biogenesis protein CcmG/thiol:disulfide interchange protein DsbE